MATKAKPVAGGGLVAFIRRNQVAAFVILAYALSWWAWVWYRLDPENVGAPILPMGPLLAALILLPIIGGWPALKDCSAASCSGASAGSGMLVVLVRPVALTLAAVRHQPDARRAAARERSRCRTPPVSRRASSSSSSGSASARSRAGAASSLPRLLVGRTRAVGRADPRGDPRDLASAAGRRRVLRLEPRALGDHACSASRSWSAGSSGTPAAAC